MAIKSDVKSSRNSKGNRYSEATKKKALQLAKQGKTAKTIAAQLNVSMFTVKDWKKKAGITRSYTSAPKQAASPIESINAELTEIASDGIRRIARRVVRGNKVDLEIAERIGRLAAVIRRAQSE